MVENKKTVEELNQAVCKGSVLTVQDEEIAFSNMQGEAVDFKAGKIGVIFDERIHKLSWPVMGPLKHRCGDIVFFKRSQLVLDDDWTFDNKIKKAFPGRNYIVSCKIVRKFQLGIPCMCKECFEASVERILVNIHGTICEYDVCSTHADKYRNTCIPGFPLREETYSNLRKEVVPSQYIVKALHG